MIKTLVVDDEKKARDILTGMLNTHCPKIEVIGQADSVIAAEELIRSLKPDLVLLDIEMPFGNGFDLLDKTRDLNFEVIFITAFDHYAVKAIKFSAFDYLLKPIDIDELKTAIDRLIQNKKDENSFNVKIENLLSEIKANSKPKRIAIPSMEGISIVNIDDIIRCEADTNYTRIFLINGDAILVSKTLKEYEDMLTEFHFVRVHHHNLININHVQKYIKGEGGYAIMSDGSSVEVSRRKKTEFIEKLSKI
jgi:two-component system LytT family response regulator